MFRGEPSPEHDPAGYARNRAQKARWERDDRVRVTLRLKYEYERDSSGRIIPGNTGRKTLLARPREKGVDVLCALAAVREARDPDTDLVILASSDSDLAPAIDEVQESRTAKIETFCWFDPINRYGFQLHPMNRSRPVWNTRMDYEDFRACWDPARCP